MAFPFLFFLSACLTTSLDGGIIHPQALRLAGLNSAPIQLRISSRVPSEITGHQYALLAIPFGAVKISDPSLYVYNIAFLKLALKGYKPIADGESSRALKLHLEVANLQTSAFDYLIARRIVCRIALKAYLYTADGRVSRYWEAVGEDSSFRTYGFAPQLQRVLNSAVENAIDDALLNLRI